MKRELISLSIYGQHYCVDVHSVREIRGWTPETGLPHAPAHIRGIVNLRGAVLPIMDLGRRLGFDSAAPSARHAILVVESRETAVGLLVDAVSDIFTVDDADIQPVPDAASDATREIVKGVIASGEKLVGLIDVAHVVEADPLAA